MSDKVIGKASKVVTPQMTAMAVGSGTLPVLATPEMIILMESAAMAAASQLAGSGQTTVGSLVNVTHKRPVPIGERITATAAIVDAEGKKLTFRVEVTDDKGIIGEGEHVRHIVDSEKFMSKM